MKIKFIFAFLLLLIANWSYAQLWEGTYQTQYGQVKLVYENGIYYGDYAGNGTILAFEYYNRDFELHGVFFNGNTRGKFLWRSGADLQTQGFSGERGFTSFLSFKPVIHNSTGMERGPLPVKSIILKLAFGLENGRQISRNLTLNR